MCARSPQAAYYIAFQPPVRLSEQRHASWRVYVGYLRVGSVIPSSMLILLTSACQCSDACLPRKLEHPSRDCTAKSGFICAMRAVSAVITILHYQRMYPVSTCASCCNDMCWVIVASQITPWGGSTERRSYPIAGVCHNVVMHDKMANTDTTN